MSNKTKTYRIRDWNRSKELNVQNIEQISMIEEAKIGSGRLMLVISINKLALRSDTAATTLNIIDKNEMASIGSAHQEILA